jgi:hypothetical protein
MDGQAQPEGPDAHPATEAAERQVAHLTGMSAEAAHAYVTYLSGLIAAPAGDGLGGLTAAQARRT